MSKRCRHAVVHVGRAGTVRVDDAAASLVLLGGGWVEIATFRCQRCGAVRSMVWVGSNGGRTLVVRGRWTTAAARVFRTKQKRG